MTCITCKHFRPTDTKIEQGECRRFPPVAIYDHQVDDFMTVFPMMFSPQEDYCGEHVDDTFTPLKED